MTKLEALTALRDKVKAGSWNGAYEDTRASGINTHSYGLNKAGMVWDAYNGSLDAAKALHEAVLPVRDYEIVARGNRRTVHVYEKPLDSFASTGVSLESTARAWLLAILEALIAKEKDT